MYQRSEHLLYDSLNSEKARKRNKIAQNKSGGEINIQRDREKMQLETIRKEKKRLEKELQKIQNKGHYMLKRPAKLSRFHGFHYTLQSQNQSHFGQNNANSQLPNYQAYGHNQSFGREEYPATQTAQIAEQLQSIFPHKLRKERMYKLVNQGDRGALAKYGVSTGHMPILSKRTSFLDDAQLHSHSHNMTETEKTRECIRKKLFHSPFGKKSKCAQPSLPPILGLPELNKEMHEAQEISILTKNEAVEASNTSGVCKEATKSRLMQDELVTTTSMDKIQRAQEIVNKRESLNSISVSDMSFEIGKVTKLLDNPNSYFDNERFAPDGGLRTCYLLPPQEKRFEEAKKARYLRQKDPFNRDVELTIPEIFSKE